MGKLPRNRDQSSTELVINGRSIGGAVGGVDQSQKHNGQYGTDGAQGDQTEAVLGGVAVTADGTHADAQSHDKGNGHGTGGHAAGIERHNQKAAWYVTGQDKQQKVTAQQQPVQRDSQQHAQQRQRQKQADAQGHGQD